MISKAIFNLLFGVFIIITSCQPIEQELPKHDFHIAKYDLNDFEDSIAFFNWKIKSLNQIDHLEQDTLFSQSRFPIGKLLYKNSTYKVYGYCDGEFGGALFFQKIDKLDSVYYLNCTCPVMIDSTENGYYITESLAHLEGTGRVLHLNSPDDLICMPLDSFYPNWHNTLVKRKVIESGQSFPEVEWELYEKFSNQGSILLDTFGLTLSLFYPTKKRNYLIYSDYYNTYLGIVDHDSLYLLDTLLDLSTWRYHDSLNNIIDGYYHYYFSRRSGYSYQGVSHRSKAKGDIFMNADSIVIAYNFRERTISQQNSDK